ncbi:hypothetical protein P9112_011467 [Eukaryota sp. TZLM1-RC]
MPQAPRSKLSDFQQISVLGRGSYGTVSKVRRLKDGKFYCLKKVILPRNQKQADAAISECHILASLDDTCNFVVHYYDSFFEKEALYIVMELAEGGNLSDYLRKHKEPLSRNTIWKFFIQTLCGLHFVHTKKILHRDLKSLNVFLDSFGNAKLGDFGISKALTETTDMAKTFIGTPLYLSPEVAQGKPYSYSSDLWSLGILLFELCTKQYPFMAENQASLLIKILTQEPAQLPSEYNEFGSILDSLLQKDPSLRASTASLLQDPLVQAKAYQLSIDIPSVEPEVPISPGLFQLKRKKSVTPQPSPIKIEPAPKPPPKKPTIVELNKYAPKQESDSESSTDSESGTVMYMGGQQADSSSDEEGGELVTAAVDVASIEIDPCKAEFTDQPILTNDEYVVEEPNETVVSAEPVKVSVITQKDLDSIREQCLSIVTESQFNRMLNYIKTHPGEDPSLHCFGIIRFDQAEALFLVQEYAEKEKLL